MSPRPPPRPMPEACEACGEKCPLFWFDLADGWVCVDSRACYERVDSRRLEAPERGPTYDPYDGTWAEYQAERAAEVAAAIARGEFES